MEQALFHVFHGYYWRSINDIIMTRLIWSGGGLYTWEGEGIRETTDITPYLLFHAPEREMGAASSVTIATLRIVNKAWPAALREIQISNLIDSRSSR